MQQSDVTTIPNLATQAAITAAAQGGLGGTLTVVVTCSPHASDCSDAQVNDLVTVKTSYPYSSFFPLTFRATFSLDSTVQMVLESLGT